MSQFFTDTADETQADGIQALGAELSDADEPTATEAAETKSDEKTEKGSRTPAGDGNVTIVDFAKKVGIKSQVMYGYFKNNKELNSVGIDRGEGVSPRYVLPEDKADAWWAEMQTKREARAAAKVAAEAASEETTTSVSE